MNNRFLEKVSKQPNGCWLWQGYRDKDGYGKFRYQDKMCRAHRVAYELSSGVDIPHDQEIHHVCENKACVNPAHLQSLTRREHFNETPHSPAFINASKSHCKNGHAFDEKNTYIKSGGYRSCRACNKDAAQRCKARKGKKVPA